MFSKFLSFIGISRSKNKVKKNQVSPEKNNLKKNQDSKEKINLKKKTTKIKRKITKKNNSKFNLYEINNKKIKKQLKKIK